MNTSIENLAKTHYENFPVGSIFLPKKIRKPIHTIYTFARVADDIADEGNLSQQERLQKLDEWESFLFQVIKGKSSNSFFVELAKIIQQYKIPVELFSQLITAFRMDVQQKQFFTFDDVLFYCTHSANPIGKMLLHLFDSANKENFLYSDNICTALQLTNFWQDVSIDVQRGRCYFPKSELEKFGYSFSSHNEEQFIAVMKFQIERTRDLFQQGIPLLKTVHKDFRFELQLIWNGGMTILEKIEKMNYNTLSKRPRLYWYDIIKIFSKTLFLR